MKQTAIVGSGPAGCYLADHLLRAISDSSVDILERLPVPFGLVRYGVAPDHQGTKAVTRVLDRILCKPRVAFFGNVEVGRDILLDELISMYDAVVLATGAPHDRKLRIPGEELPWVLGSAAFVAWYNAHPEALTPVLEDITSAVIIGNGNVALDVARMLARDREELTGSDLPSGVSAWLQSQPLTDIHIVGRRAASDAKFHEHELAELGKMGRAQPRMVGPLEQGENQPVLRVLREFISAPRRGVPVTIHFHFKMSPVRFIGSSRLQGVQFCSEEGYCELPAQLAVTCIGYEATSCCSLQPSDGAFANDQGKIRNKLYVVGWAKRGSSGTIPTNRIEAQQLAQHMATEVTDAGGGGRRSLLDHLQKHGIRAVDYAGWKRIETAENACADPERCRRKFKSVAEMLNAASEPVTF
jgi:NADPH-dependent glutamate synthase beta subunit-like oxidoreductase